jgi:hypothetical protein
MQPNKPNITERHEVTIEPMEAGQSPWTELYQDEPDHSTPQPKAQKSRAAHSSATESARATHDALSIIFNDN